MAKKNSDLVIVESPAKAKTIEKYLGDGFTVLSSYGHVRDLPERPGGTEHPRPRSVAHPHPA